MIELSLRVIISGNTPNVINICRKFLHSLNNNFNSSEISSYLTRFALDSSIAIVLKKVLSQGTDQHLISDVESILLWQSDYKSPLFTLMLQDNLHLSDRLND